MERMRIIVTQHADWLVVSSLLENFPGIELETKTMEKPEWELDLTGMDESLKPVLEKIQTKTPKTICLGIKIFSKLMFTYEGEEKLLHEISRTFQVNVHVGHLSENGQHISIETDKETLGKIQTFLAEKDIISSLF